MFIRKKELELIELRIANLEEKLDKMSGRASYLQKRIDLARKFSMDIADVLSDQIVCNNIRIDKLDLAISKFTSKGKKSKKIKVKSSAKEVEPVKVNVAKRKPGRPRKNSK